MMNNRNNAMELNDMTQSEYIEAAFKAYFPDSSVTVDDETEAETIHVHVVTHVGPEANHMALTSWSFEASSDDDRYVFVALHGQDPSDPIDPSQVITVPLMPEEG
jgi:hypothetical protein